MGGRFVTRSQRCPRSKTNCGHKGPAGIGSPECKPVISDFELPKKTGLKHRNTPPPRTGLSDPARRQTDNERGFVHQTDR